MKKLLSLVLALASVLCMATFASDADDSALVLQDLDYTEVIGRVNQMDSGFTISSKYIYPGGRYEGEAPMNDANFQFYYIGLNRWSTDAGGKDGPIDQWYLDWLDASFANLRANGGGCMIRATYALDGHERREPQTFDMLLTHQRQLAQVFSKYPDIISSVECGMIGAFGEMWGGKYSNARNKMQVLAGWLEQLPDEITVNVRTVDEYITYVNSTDLYKTKYRHQTIDGVKYPASLNDSNFYKFDFEGEIFSRVGCYNDAMIQDGNDGGSFAGGRDNFNEWLGRKSTNIAYGGEFSGAAGEFRFGNSFWLPMKAISEFYVNNLSYYHGGNNAYKVTGRYHGDYSIVRYFDTKSAADNMVNWMQTVVPEYGSGMAYDVAQDCARVVFKEISGTDANGNTTYKNTPVEYATFEEAKAAADAFVPKDDGEKATPQYGVSLYSGGWSSATYTADTVEYIVENLYRTSSREESERVYPTADLDDYIGQPISDFFEDHLGYRIVLRESYISESAKRGGTFTVKGALENVGFANIIRDKVTEIVLTDGENTYVAETDIDCSEWLSAERTEYEAELKLPSSIPAGDYDVYMRTAGQDLKGVTAEKGCVRFCNPGQFTYQVPGSAYSVGNETLSIIYDSQVCGNYIGALTVSEETVPGSDDNFKQVASDFEDVPAGKWYAGAVKDICALGLMNGTSDTTFAPEGITTRGQLATVLYNMENKPDTNDMYHPFDDVPANRYYANPVTWAYNADVVTGTSSNTFTPDGKLTREQFATMLYRYAQYKGYDVSDRAELDAYEDEGDVSNYAKEAMSWANAKGYITGMTATTLVPKGQATRAQMATILLRYVLDETNAPAVTPDEGGEA